MHENISVSFHRLKFHINKRQVKSIKENAFKEQQ